jgi:hypothetical protein
VFVDRSGSRRKVVIVAGSTAAVFVLVALVTLVVGLTGAAPLQLPGLPEPGRPATDAGGHSPAPEPTTTARPVPTPAASTPSGPPGPPESSGPPGQRNGQSNRPPRPTKT